MKIWREHSDKGDGRSRKGSEVCSERSRRGTSSGSGLTFLPGFLEEALTTTAAGFTSCTWLPRERRACFRTWIRKDRR